MLLKECPVQFAPTTFNSIKRRRWLKKWIIIFVCRASFKSLCSQMKLSCCQSAAWKGNNLAAVFALMKFRRLQKQRPTALLGTCSNNPFTVVQGFKPARAGRETSSRLLNSCINSHFWGFAGLLSSDPGGDLSLPLHPWNLWDKTCSFSLTFYKTEL